MFAVPAAFAPPPPVNDTVGVLVYPLPPNRMVILLTVPKIEAVAVAPVAVISVPVTITVGADWKFAPAVPTVIAFKP
jgi:hypothetical protein